MEELEKENSLLKKEKEEMNRSIKTAAPGECHAPRHHMHRDSLWKSKYHELKPGGLGWFCLTHKGSLCSDVGRETQNPHWILVEKCDTASVPGQLKLTIVFCWFT